ncbi:MAG: PAS domain-containing protein [Rubrivivax sp.]|nr:PAS domain-containing protein [Rubrivivax sp.]
MSALPRPDPSTTALFDALPVAGLLLDEQGRVLASNAAARLLLGPASATGVAWPAVLGTTGDGRPGAPMALPGTPCWLRLRPAPWGAAGRLLLLEDATAEVLAQQEVARLAERLDLTQDFGRLGLWERDVQSLQGQWDRHVFKFWGLDPDGGAPDFDAAARQIVDEDRAGLEQAFRRSLQAAGVYSHRYRVRRPDGRLSSLHSQWAVKDGPDGRPARVIGVMMDDTEAIDLAQVRTEMASQLGLAETLADLVVWRHDLRSNRVQFNGAGAALFAGVVDGDGGIDAPRLRALVHPEDQALARQTAEAAVHQPGHTDLELRYQLPDGREPHLMTRRVIQRDPQGEPVAVLGVGLDITERAAAARRAREMSERFELATRTAGIGYWANEGNSGRAEWSDQMRALHGLPAEAPVPTLKEWMQQFVHPEDQAHVRESFRAWLSGLAPRAQAELRVVRTDGAVRHLLTHSLQERGGAMPLLFGIAIDVTERRLADIALRRADERAALAARGAGIGTWELDWRDGSVHWDPQMWRLRGREPRQAPPANAEIVSFVHPDDREQAARRVTEANASTDTLEHQFRVVWPDGAVRWLASRSTALRDAEGRLMRRIGVNWDITAARQAEAERSEREAAEQANQAKSQFLARMSHELRTPLNAVLGFAQLLLLDAPTEPQRQRLDYIRGAGQHLLSLINDVLDLSSLDTGELRIEAEAVDLAALVQETLPLLDPLRGHGDLRLDLDIAPLWVQADPVRLRQVLLNLLSNAFKYNRPGGSVQVSARAEGAQVVLAVADTGRGMNPGQLRQLFEPFNRLGAQRDGIEGTGIGLAIVKGLVDRMQGRIDVQSEPGEGTVFTVRLPAARRQLLSPARGVLYIEDNPVNTLIVRELMQRRPDVRLLHAADGRSGLALARREQPALVLLDMQLPDMEGRAVLAALREDPATADIRCIAVSANVVAADVARALADGLAAYWTKPLDAAAFGSAIEALFGPPPV